MTSIEVADQPFTAQDVDQVALGYLWGRHAPWWAILVKGALVYALHRREIEETLSLVPQVLSHLQEIKRRNPKLHAQIINTTRAELLQQTSAPAKVSATPRRDREPVVVPDRRAVAPGS